MFKWSIVIFLNMINFSMISSPSQSNHRTFPDQEAEKDKIRFQVELEFVQCLGNPNYLNFLAQRGYFKDPAFINYLKYLQYWSKPDYVKFLKFPVCLHFLELLQHESFRKEIVKGEVWINFIFSYETEKNFYWSIINTTFNLLFTVRKISWWPNNTSLAKLHKKTYETGWGSCKCYDCKCCWNSSFSISSIKIVQVSNLKG